ncbi:hypothetical protein P8605_44220, partial [Streptomyces sp. T-3]|nr:hypothetical protein [Streptomyces sp. T-3]
SAARDQRAARLAAAYDCALPSGTQPTPSGTQPVPSDAQSTPTGTQAIEVALDAEFPERGAVGKPIRPVAVTVRASLSRSVVARLLPEGTKAVSGTATLATTVAQGRERARAEWAGLAADAVALPAEGAVEFGFSGDVPHVTVGSAGEVTFTAGQLDLTLTAEGSPDTGTGTDAEPQPTQSVALTCTPDRDADLLFATVPVEAPATGTPDAPSTGTAEPGAGTPKGIDAGPRPRAAADECPAQPPEGKLDPKRLPAVPPGGEVTESEPSSACAVPVGFATMRKLKGSAIVNDPRNPRVGLMHLGMLM